MFTCFWHLWSWLDPPVTSPLASPAVITMASIKKSGGGSGVIGGGTMSGGSVLTPTRRNSQVRSPCIKRLPSAPVTLQGWLHKQGSDGLMLWKKRWFVLSDYCLFYYKGQEEEKLLGSILLPSYRISPCSSEDKVYRKFSFKAEHANMRTYYFAADSHQQMAQWMNALSLASILQDSGNCWDEHRSGGSALNSNRNNNNNTTNTCDDSDSGFQTNQRLQPHQNYNDMPNNPGDHSANVNNWQNCHNMQLPPGYQPLYANAPPKPRRLNDSSSTERSPERLHDDSGGRTSRMGAQPQQEYNRNYSTNVQHYSAQHSHHRTVNNLYVINNNINNSSCNTSNIISTAQLNNSERRTPDTYGRSNTATPCAQQAVIRVNRAVKQRNPDYEDVYQNNPDVVATTNHLRCSNTIPYASNNQVHYRRKQNQVYHNMVPESVDVTSERQRRFQVRPHSADFLEYDAARYYSPTPQSSDSSNVYDGRPMPQSQVRMGGGRGQHQQKPRPKSSMEIAHPSDSHNGFDSQHWSEESYARKMRQSASFVAPQLQVPNPSSRATTPSLKHSFPGSNFAYQAPYPTKQLAVPGSAVMRNHCEVIERQEKKWNEYVENRSTVPFVRSASARLARQLPDEEFPSAAGQNEAADDSGQLAFKRRNSSDTRESGTKIQQREESMKRLLEWKQRMLQSPLTRKNSGSSSGGRKQNELKHYKQQLANQQRSSAPLTDATMDWHPTADPVHQQQRAVSTMPEMRSSRRKEDPAHQAPRSATTRSRSQDGRRSANLASRYTSYSSDDEEVEETRESWKRTRRLSQQSKTRPDSWDGKQAGNYENLELARSVDNPSTNQKPRTSDTKSVSFERSRTLKSLTNPHEISPGSDYVGSFNSVSENKNGATSQILNYDLNDETNSKTLTENSLVSGADLLETSQENFSFLHSQHNSNRQQIFSSKHSDSGYDTLKTGLTLSSDPEVRDLLKFRFDKNHTTKDVTVYPVQVKQGKPDTSKEPWQTKLDESRLIKEFSYQYIKLGKDEGSNEEKAHTSTAMLSLSKHNNTPPQNLVQHRIKAFEGSGEEDKDDKSKDGKLKMQDPLRVTSPVYHPNEAHVSMLRSTDSLTPSPCDMKQSTPESTNLRRMRRTSLHGFALGDATLALDEDAKIVLEEEHFAKKTNPKSVRDLLADFEKKSQLAKEQLAAEERISEESPGKRCVFSDTETLLYDTSSDAECQSNSESVLSKIRRPEMLVSEDDEEDRDEEVAAVLGKRDTFFSACRDLGRKNETSTKQKTKSENIDQSYLDSMSTGYKRLSVADSMITHEDLDSHCSSPGQKSDHKHVPPSLNIRNVDASEVLEEHYMPMTPSKKSVLAPPNEGGLVSHTRSNSASQTLIMENLLVNEESSYVEMTENGMIRSLLAPESNKKFASKSDLQRMASNTSNTDSACYTEIDQAAQMSSPLSAHYELLYRSGGTSNSQTEPLYMEVNSLPSDEKCLEISAAQERSEKLSQESLNKRAEGGDGAENPHPASVSRAALPDILNSSTNVSNQKQSSIKSDSSDADDEASKDLDSLDAPRHPRFSLSDTFRPASYYLGASMVERTLVGMNSEQQDSSDSDLVSPPPIPTSPPPMDDLETSLESTIDMKKSSPLHMKNDKQDSADVDKDSKLWNSNLSHSDDTITEHMDKYFSTSISRLDETVSSETDSIESCRRDRLKRRPVSADVLHSLNRPYDLLDLEDGMNVDLDQYLADLNVMSEVSHNLPLNSNHRLYQSEKYLPGDISSHNVQNSSSINVNSYQVDSDEVQYENLQLMYPQPPLPPPTSSSLDELSIEHDVDNDTYITLENPMHLTETMVMVRGTEENQDGAVDQNGAPYYYADLLKGDPNAAHVAVENINILTHSSSSQAVRNPRVGSMLNNQRESPVEIICSNKRNDVGRKVNQIHGAMGSTYPELEEMDDATRLALELRNSARFLSDKSEFVDERNLYESNTLRRKTVSMSGSDNYRSQTPDALGSNTNSHNIYPNGIRDKDVSSKQTTRRRSRSLEGLLDEPDFQNPPEPSRSSRVSPGNAISRLLQTTRPQTQTNIRASTANIAQNIASSSRAQGLRAPPPPPDVWEEDTLWRENLRRASLRHTRSLDDLDRDTPTVEEEPAVPKHQQGSPHVQQQPPPQQQQQQQPVQNCKLSRDVTYVNDSVVHRRVNHREYEEDYREGRSKAAASRQPVPDVAAPVDDDDDDALYERLVRDDSGILRPAQPPNLENGVREEDRRGNKPVSAGNNSQPQPFLDIGWYPTRPPSFEIDREKLRQWDLMSSAPSGMVGAGRIPAMSHVPPQMAGRILPLPAKNHVAHPDFSVPPPSRPADSTKSADPVRQSDLVDCHKEDLPPNSSQASGSGSVIGRDPLPPRTIIDKQPHASTNGTMPVPISHSQSQRAISPHHPAPLYTPPPGPIMRQPEPDLSHKRARLAELETPKRMEHLQKLEDLKRHLLELEKQYEKGKPLVNLVDNMVKLGSLYRAGSTSNGLNSPSTVNLNSPLFRERLEFNHKVQEQRLLAEERKDWDRLSPDHNQLQAKVAQLYRLDKLLQEESGTLHSLQQDKEMLEQALGGLRHKLQVIDNNPVEAERYRKQQRLLERELTRVRSILAHNSKKLEETVAENARLEQELVVLRQKVQTSRRIPDPATGPTTAALEAELRRVQTLVGDLQRQRHELSVQVRQLTDKSRTLSQQIRPGPTGVAGPILGKKRSASSWLETDLDSQVTRDLGLGLDSPTPTPTGLHTPTSLASPVPPLYVNTDDSSAPSPTNISSTNSELASRDDMAPLPANSTMSSHQMQYCRPMDISEADDRIKRFYGIIPKDKPQEIKTVRIVKRESERRQRDRDRSGNIGIPLTNNISSKRLPYLDEYGTTYTSEQQQQQQLPQSSSSSSMTSSATSVLSRVMEEHENEPPSISTSSSVPPPAPGPRTDSVNAIRNLVNRQQLQLAKSKLDQSSAMSGSSSSSTQLSATEQLFGPSSPQLSPVYQSEAARQIIEEMSANKVTNKRLVPREKRRHHTVSGRPLFRIDTSYAAGGSRDDLDMERALRPRLNAPDVVRSTLSRVDTKFSSETIDNLLGTPNKILIPERYVPETSPELSVEEQAKRNKKADAIRKMLSETTSTGTIVSQDAGSPNEVENEMEEEKSSTLKKKVQEEKRQREHLLQLNQILAQQVMEKSKIVAGSTPNVSSPASCSPGSGHT